MEVLMAGRKGRSGSGGARVGSGRPKGRKPLPAVKPTALVKRADADLGTLFSSDHYAITLMGLRVTPGADLEEWQRTGYRLRVLGRGAQWAVCDWLAAGDADGRPWTADHATGILDWPVDAVQRAARAGVEYADFASRQPLLGLSYHLAVVNEADRAALLAECARRVAAGQPDVREWLRDLLRERRHKERTIDRPWPKGKYGVIYMDPPWRPDDGALDPTRQIENQYPTMAIDELVEMLKPKVKEVAATDCAIFCWVTSPKIVEYVSLMEALEFAHKSAAVWVKDSIGMGYWFRSRHEHLCVATRGAPATALEQNRPDSVITEPRRAHSQKPDRIYAMLDVMFPGVPKIELFARPNEKRPDHWAAWGNEALGPREGGVAV
jgi:N6-adenosine-specific RNA methylase IME4